MVGVLLLALAIVGLPPVRHLLDWRQILLGLLALPAAAIAIQALRLVSTEEQLYETGGLASVINCVALLGLLTIPATRDVTLVFLGASLLIAAVRGYGGCETLAVSNWLLRRDDQVGCLIFSPLDRAESRMSGRLI
ncbi:MAG TPA: hypothetical protein VFR33_13100 [Candidatus Dormibacteraeota bacterium]|nr:hypothetical protein [Candidatus Dormibacteraeota bacterium]